MKRYLKKHLKSRQGRHGKGQSPQSIDSSITGNAYSPEGNPVSESGTTQQIPMGDPPTSFSTTIPTAGSPGSIAGTQHDGIFQAGGMFSYASNFSLNNSLLVGIQTPSGSEAFQWLIANAMVGVEHNSSARAPPPKCHDGTRLDMIARTLDLLRGPDPKQKLLWIHGPVGVGKTAITQTLAEREAQNARLGATLFFPKFFPSLASAGLSRHIALPLRPHGDDPRIWITISYQLATKDVLYKTHITRLVHDDPKLVERSMEHQFKTLIAEPIGQKGLIRSSHTLSIWFDGLDQCCQRNSLSQKELLQLIIDFVQDYPSSPLVWIIVSRPEPHLVTTFENYLHLEPLSVPVKSEDSHRDVQHFLRCNFDSIQENNNTIQPLPWPKEKDFKTLLLAVSGFFLFAAAVIQFVRDPDVNDPMSQLSFALTAITSQPPNDENPLAPVHQMYAHVLQSIPSNIYPTTKRILGFSLLPSGFGNWTRDNTSFWALCNILNIKMHVAYSCLNKLHSLLEIPKSEDATRMPARFYHESFAHYLANRRYSETFWIDTKEVVADLWQCHFRALQATLTRGHLTPDLSEIGLVWPSSLSNTVTFRKFLWENARRVFFHHLLPCPSHRCALGLHYDALSNLENPSELLQVLQNINYHHLVDGYAFPDVPYRFLAFLRWVVGEGQTYLQKGGISQKFDAANQEIDKNATSFVIRGRQVDGGGHIVGFEAYTDHDFRESMGGVHPSRLFSTREKPQPLAQLLSVLPEQGNGFPGAIVLGPNLNEQCMIRIDTSLENQINYYVLPLRPRQQLIVE